MPPAFDLSKLKNIKLTKEQQQYIGVGVVIFGVMIWLYWTKLMVPLNKTIVEKREALTAEKVKLEEARKFSPEEYAARMNRVQAGMDFVMARLPTAESRYVGITRLIRITLENGVEMTKYKPKRTTAGRGESEYKGYTKNTADVEILTDYHGLGRFLSELTGEEMLYLIEDLKLGALSVDPRNPSAPRVKANFKVITYTEDQKKEEAQ